MGRRSLVFDLLAFLIFIQTKTDLKACFPIPKAQRLSKFLRQCKNLGWVVVVLVGFFEQKVGFLFSGLCFPNSMEVISLSKKLASTGDPDRSPPNNKTVRCCHE